MKVKAKRVLGDRREAFTEVAALKATTRHTDVHREAQRRTRKPQRKRVAKAPIGTPVAQHLTDAHLRLVALRTRIGEHRLLEDAIERIETVLNQLTLSTGGLL